MTIPGKPELPWRKPAPATLSSLMLYAIALHAALRAVQDAIGNAALWSFGGAKFSNKKEVELRERVITSLTTLGLTCQDLGFRVSGQQILRVRLNIENETIEETQILAAVIRALNVVHDEISAHAFFYLTEPEASLFANRKPFGDAVCNAFPGAIQDAEEAAKCLALNRGTACAFHCLRAIDLVVCALIREFHGGAAFFEKHERRVWSEYVRRIREEANKADDMVGARWAGRRDRLGRIAESLNMVADASRNPTMHARANYSVEQACDIFNTTGALLRRLAEDFQPIAVSGDSGPRPKPDSPPRGQSVHGEVRDEASA